MQRKIFLFLLMEKGDTFFIFFIINIIIIFSFYYLFIILSFIIRFNNINIAKVSYNM